MSREFRLLVPSSLRMHHMLLTSGAVKLCSHEVLRRACPGGSRPARSAARSIRLISRNLVAGVLLVRNA